MCKIWPSSGCFNQWTPTLMVFWTLRSSSARSKQTRCSTKPTESCFWMQQWWPRRKGEITNTYSSSFPTNSTSSVIILILLTFLPLFFRQLCVDALVEEGDKNSDWRLNLQEFQQLFDSTYVPSDKSKKELILLKDDVKDIWDTLAFWISTFHYLQ